MGQSALAQGAVLNDGSVDTFVGVFNRDTSLASGTQAVTGVGFQPKSVVFITGTGAVAGVMSWGFGADDGNADRSWADNNNNTASGYSSSDTNCINALFGGGASYAGNIQSYDADGFTISWTKTGSPTATIGNRFIAFK